MVHALVPAQPPLVPIRSDDDGVQENQALWLKLELLLDLRRVLQDHLQLRREELRLALLELDLSEGLHHPDLLCQGVLERQLGMYQLEEPREGLVLDVDVDRRERDLAGGRLP